MKLPHNTISQREGSVYMQYTTTNTDRQADSLGALWCAPGDVLQDVSPNGRAVPWASHKQASQALAVALAFHHPAIARRIEGCADRLTFRRDWTDAAQPGRLRLAQAFFCRARLCPMCQWRRSLKMHGQVRACLERLAADRLAAKQQPYRFALLTLTVRNCEGEALEATLDVLQHGWQRLTRLKAFGAAVQGYVRATEITYNRHEDTYHPHMHVLLAVLPSYFTGRTYISQARWRAMWREAARLNYDPSVDVRRAADDAKTVAEVAKYATKPGDYLMPSDVERMANVLDTLQRSCAGRRFASWGGVLRTAHQALGLDDAEDGDLVHLTQDAGESDAGAALWSWDWYAGPHLYISTEKGARP